jgi:hypothetical protein
MGDLSHHTDGNKKLGWGASWLLPEEWTAAWGARAIAEKDYSPNTYQSYKHGTHIASLLPDRQSGAGNNESLKGLLAWINDRLLPIRMFYDGRSTEITILDDGCFHARWTPNGSFGYIEIVAWMD